MATAHVVKDKNILVSDFMVLKCPCSSTAEKSLHLDFQKFHEASFILDGLIFHAGLRQKFFEILC